MKKLVIGFGSIVVLFIAVIIVLATVDFNRIGKDNMYVQIPEQSMVEEMKLDSGEIMTRYWYTVLAYNDKGEEVELEFSAAKELRADAYLMMYVKDGDQVSSYDEVQEKDIPEKALAQLKKNE